MASGDPGGRLVARMRRVCLALPEAAERESAVGCDFRVGRRAFASFFSVTDPEGRAFSMLVCRADPDEREVLRNIGHPYFVPRTGVDRIGMILDATTDWTEVAELVTESYRILAPKRLAASLEDGSSPIAR